MKLFFILLTLCGVAGNVQPSYLVDISALLENKDPEAQRQVKLQIDQGLRENGLIVITGHGLTTDLSRKSFDSARALFELESSSKQEVAIRNDKTSFGRGYLGFGDESGLSSTFEPKEGFSYGNSLTFNTSNLLSLPNKWPSSLPAQEIHTFNTLYDEKVRVAHLIVSALSEMFSCTGDSNDGNDGGEESRATDLYGMIAGGREISLMRLFHYFHQQSPTVQQHLQALRSTTTTTTNPTDESPSTAFTASPSAMLGSSPHTDWGFLTLILADEVGGLQFIPKGGSVSEHSWVDVPYIPGSLVVNGGDYLKLVSKGVYHSPIHRVLSPGSRRSPDSGACGSVEDRATEGDEEGGVEGGKGADTCPDRYSFVFFFYPSYSSPVSDQVLGHCTHYLNAEIGSAEATIDSTGGASTRHKEHQGETFNTLLALEEGGKATTGAHQFGDYVIKKWKGVYRREETY